MKLSIRDFAQISEADIEFGEPGDLTLLLGQQATGKSLVLQWLKLLTDPLAVRRDWERYGSNWKAPAPLRPLDLFFGEGLGAGFRPNKTRVALDGVTADLASLFRKPRSGADEPVETTYYIPAHRALLLADGWPKNFQQHSCQVPAGYKPALRTNRVYQRAISRSAYELPGICTVKMPNLDRFKQGRIEVSQIHAVVRTRFGIQRLPMRCTAASFTTHSSQRLVTLDVFVGILGMA